MSKIFVSVKMSKILEEGDFVFCCDTEKWYLYMGCANLRLPRRRRLNNELNYWKLNHNK